MNHFISSLFVCVLLQGSLLSYAITWNVEVGGQLGSTTNPPFFNPQFLEITEGDVVQWTWVSGPHNVTSTAGPLFFSSGDLNAGGTFNVTFTVSAFYTYANTIGNSANTAYGTIFVLPLIIGVSANTSAEALDDVDLLFSSNTQQVTMHNPTSLDVLAIWYDVNGRMIFSQQVIAYDSQIKSAPELSTGVYLVFLRTSRAMRTRKIFIP